MLLALSLVGIVSQRLVPTSDGKARVAAIEILLPTPRVKDLIKDWDISGVKQVLAAGGGGVQSFDEALYRLVKAGRLTKEDATRYADAPADFRLRFRLEESAKPTDGAKLALR